MWDYLQCLNIGGKPPIYVEEWHQAGLGPPMSSLFAVCLFGPCPGASRTLGSHCTCLIRFQSLTLPVDMWHHHLLEHKTWFLINSFYRKHFHDTLSFFFSVALSQYNLKCVFINTFLERRQKRKGTAEYVPVSRDGSACFFSLRKQITV